jgi:putative Holliday junction resolvase
MRILGIDYGDRTLGLALTDPLGVTARPFASYRLQARDEDNRLYFRDLVERHQIELIVVGIPLRMDGTPGTRADKTRAFALWLEAAVERPVVFWDERLTTREALSVLGSQNIRGESRKELKDQVAAAIILSAYLESRRESHDP